MSTTFAYFGNRHLSFSHRARTGIKRETGFFFGINGITLVFSELVLALFVYGFGYDHASTMVAVVNIVTIGLGTIFRFWAYKRFVFLHPDRVHSPGGRPGRRARRVARPATPSRRCRSRTPRRPGRRRAGGA